MMKRIQILIITFLLFVSCVATYATASDNDGSAFISKAEFDSLKNTFQSQLDEYNKGIDTKIDAAIAQYLAGATVASEMNVVPLLSGINEVNCVDEDNVWQWKGGQTHIYEIIRWNVAGSNKTASVSGGGRFLFTRESPAKTPYTKLIIEEKEDAKGTKKLYWVGYSDNCTEEIFNKSIYSEKPGDFDGWQNLWLGGLRNLAADGDFGSTAAFQKADLIVGGYRSADATGKTYYTMPGAAAIPIFSINDAVFTWGVPKYEHIITYKDAPANFSVKNEVRYWRNSLTDPSGYKTGNIDTALNTIDQLAKTEMIDVYLKKWGDKAYVHRSSVGYETSATTNRICFGFHKTAKKFSAINCSDRSDISVKINRKTTINLGDIKPYNGWPLVACENGSIYRFDVEFKDKTKDYILYANNAPFGLVDYKSATAVTGNEKLSFSRDVGYASSLKITAGKGTVYFKATSDCLLWLKWTIDGGNGGGDFIQPAIIRKITK